MRFLTCLLIVFFLGFILFTPDVRASVTDRPFLIGWYTSINHQARLSEFQQNGMNLVLTYHTTGAAASKVSSYLDEAERLGIKVILEIPRNITGRSGDFNLVAISNFVNQHKGKPAVYGWYIADEPDFNWCVANPPRQWASPDSLFQIYQTIKSLDPNHFVSLADWGMSDTGQGAGCRGVISFGQPNHTFSDVVDLYMNDWYPRDCKECSGCGGYCQVSSDADRQNCINCIACPNCQDKGAFSSMIRSSYNIWQDGLSQGRSRYIAIVDGYNDIFSERYHDGRRKYGARELSLTEYRYHVYSAVVQGIDGLLFWQEIWSGETSSGAGDSVKELLVYPITAEIQSIGRQMNTGKTRGETGDTLSVNIPADDLVYRYGVYNNRYVILAVNIDGHENSSNIDPDIVGEALNNVRFTLPAGIRPSSVTAVGEDRSLPVGTNGVFTDNFSRYQVHIYKFTASSGPTPTPPSLRQIISQYGTTETAFDINSDGLVNGLDFASVLP